MHMQCPNCDHVVQFDEESADKGVRCPKCSATVLHPRSTAVTTAPRQRSAARDEEDDRYDERRETARPPSNRSSAGIVILILALVGLPFLILFSCVGVSALMTLMTRDEFEEDMFVEVPPMAMPPVAVEAEGPEFIAPDNVGGIQPIDPIGLAPEPPALADMARLNAFIDENLKPNNQVGPLAPDARIWVKIAADIEQNRLEQSPLIKGNWGNVNFRETAPDGGILVGFFASAPNNFLVHYVQPIYLTPKGEKVGKAFGSPSQRVVCIKAKEGYAVGAIDVRSGDLFDAFTVRFMRVQGEALDPRDAYSSIQVGGNGGDPLRVGGDGALLVGIHGRSLAQANITPAGSIASLGVLSLR